MLLLVDTVFWSLRDASGRALLVHSTSRRGYDCMGSEFTHEGKSTLISGGVCVSFVTKCHFNWEESWRKMISGASGYFVRMVLERCAKEGGGLQDVDAAVLRVSCCCCSWFQVTQLLLRFPSEHVPCVRICCNGGVILCRCASVLLSFCAFLILCRCAVALSCCCIAVVLRGCSAELLCCFFAAEARRCCDAIASDHCHLLWWW